MSRIFIGSLICMLLALAGCGVEWFPEDGNVLEPTPAAFSFKPALCQLASTSVTSDDVDITGVTAQATVKIDTGEYSLDKGVTWLKDASFVTPTTDQKLTIRVRHTTASTTAASSVVISLVSVGNTTGAFYSDIARTTACP